jgi:hypothetical protein
MSILMPSSTLFVVPQHWAITTSTHAACSKWSVPKINWVFVSHKHLYLCNKRLCLVPKLNHLLCMGIVPCEQYSPFPVVYHQYFAKNFTNANNFYVHTSYIRWRLHKCKGTLQTDWGIDWGTDDRYINSFTTTRVWAGMKKSRPVGFLW